jgi:hypothetical protein
MDGSGPGPTPPALSPLELSRDWYNIEAAPIASNTSFNIYGQVAFDGPTAPEQAIAYTTNEPADGGISFVNRYVGETIDYSSFWGAIRMQDHATFIGVRFYNGEVQIYERIDLTFLSLGTKPATQAMVGQAVSLIARGAEVLLFIGGSLFLATTTNLLDSGRVGVVARSWPAQSIFVADTYKVII